MSTSKLVQYGSILGGGMISAYILASLAPPPNSNQSQQNIVQQPPQPPATPTSTTSTTTPADLPKTLLSQINKESLLSSQIESASDDAISLATIIGKYGFLSCDNLRFHESCVSSISYANKQPNWVCEYLTLITT